MLNSNSSTPLYIQLKQAIADDINDGIYTHGEKLPTEPELCEKYKVSRITVRKAVLDLVNEGYLIKKQGKGTFVNHVKIKRELVAVNGYSEYMNSTGKMPNPKIISYEVKEVNKEIAEKLKIDTNSPVLELKRLLHLDNEPLLHETSTYSLELFPELDQYVEENKSMHKILNETYGRTPAFNNKILNVILANSELAGYLQCNISDPLYQLEKVAYNKDKDPLYHSLLYYNVNKVSFTITSEFESTD
ncbi:GntR family transcriptional regulator [Niallia circulans]|uniref:GntR family transcriptional regulator n=1 Tax=Niallia circulans TaxID=1397 RepID=UPI0026EF46D3|nr:GntR family transcriptional regulator [Niallia circulans]